MSDAVAVRRLVRADVVALRDIRLEALRTEPASFGADWEQYAAWPMSAWEYWVDHAYLVGAFDGGQLAGMAGVSIRSGSKKKHVGEFGAFYVRPDYRGRGIGDALIQAALAHARQHVEMVVLTVEARNERAIKLYARYGFVACGQFPRALCVDGEFHDELSMIAIFHANYPFG